MHEIMSSYESEMNEETHRFKQYESLPVKAENHGKQRENSIRVTMHDSLSGLSQRLMMSRESGKPAQVADVDTNPPLVGTTDNYAAIYTDINVPR
jgi:hypothetical protein